MSTVKPVLTEYELGTLGWRTLHDLAFRRGRNPRNQAIQLVLRGLAESIAGADVELTQAQYTLLGLDPVAAA